MTLHELAKQLDARIERGSGKEEISSVEAIGEARAGSVCFISNPSYEKYLSTTQASAVIISEALVVTENVSTPALLRTPNPYVAFARAIELFNPRKDMFVPKVHPSAVISPSAKLHESVGIGAHVYVGEDVTIGEGSAIHPGAVIYDNTVIGRHVVIGAGSVIGFDGFGYAATSEKTFTKIPQIGNVIIEDDVEIGALCTIDRATLNHTIIHRGVKLDNLVHIAHNVEIGEDTVIAAQTGISGSAKIGKRNQIAGQVGMIGHITIADDVTIIAQSGVSKAITKSGTYFGAPAKEFRAALRQEGALAQLPELLQRVRELEEKIRILEGHS
ncbi:MAG: UDP-3-O-(3-hydroxymyristoyl)glucosamine N-acyltransferase [bacterium]